MQQGGPGGRLALATKRTGLREYGNFASEYAPRFHRRRLRGESRDDAALLGAANIQSLADVGRAISIVIEMKPLRFDRDAFINLVGAGDAPVRFAAADDVAGGSTARADGRALF